MRADGVGHHQAAVPGGGDGEGVVMGGEADGGEDMPRQCPGGGAGGAGPAAGGGLVADDRPVAGERELAAGPLRPLVHHAAHRRREGGVANAVEDHLRHRLLAGVGLAGGLVIDGGGQAFQGADPVDLRRSAEIERPCRDDAQVGGADRQRRCLGQGGQCDGAGRAAGRRREFRRGGGGSRWCGDERRGVCGACLHHRRRPAPPCRFGRTGPGTRRASRPAPARRCDVPARCRTADPRVAPVRVRSPAAGL